MSVKFRDVANQVIEGITEDFELSRKDVMYKLYKKMLKDINGYVPYDTGYLQNSTNITYGRGSFDIEYIAKYAKYLYKNETNDYSDKGNPDATPYWFEKAQAEYGEEWSRYLLELVEGIYG